MYNYIDCLPCIIKTADKIANINCKSKEEKYKFMNTILLDIFNTPKEKRAPSVYANVHKRAKEMFNYVEVSQDKKNYFNKKILEIESSIDKDIVHSDDPIFYALKIALAGNIIDFATVENISLDLVHKYLNDIVKSKINFDLYNTFINELINVNDLVYIGDNMGEIVFDKIFIKYIKKLYQNINITYITRGEQVSSDITKKDAYFVGMDKFANILDNGTAIPGTDLEEISKKAFKVITNADLIIAKGQGNFESLVDSKLNIYYLFLCKCNVFTKRFNLKKFTPVFMKEKK